MPLISKRPPASVAAENVRVWSSALSSRTVADFSGSLAASLTTIPATVQEAGSEALEDAAGDCAAKEVCDSAANSTAEKARIGLKLLPPLAEVYSANLCWRLDASL